MRIQPTASDWKGQAWVERGRKRPPCRSRQLANLLAFLLVALFVAGPAGAQEKPLAVQEIAPGVYVHRGAVALATEENRGDIANLGFIVGEQSVAVVDTGGSAAVGEALLAAVRATTAKPIRYVINTHMHPDHIFGNAPFARVGIPIVGAEQLPSALAARAAHYLEANQELLGSELAHDIRIVAPTILVSGRLKLDLGGRELDLRVWPTAHTDNDLTVFDSTTGTLFAGDLVFLNHVPVVDGSIRGWLAVMDELAAIPARRVVPGHGPAAAPWPQALEAQRRYLEAVASQVRDLIASGGRIEDAPARVAQDESTRWKLFPFFHPRNVTAAFAELEWE